ncbi:MAG TPA: hypothetical protein VM935_01685 [Chitinophagaceae bacterium]|jgi:hypothetical protein|nr:hypothetical protein [Chitinophagaceae bacterium]
MIRRTLLTAILASICMLIGCKKESREPGLILQGYKDSMDRFNATYTNGKINALSVFDDKPMWKFQYKEKYVKASRDGINVEYFLNNANLPNKISRFYFATSNYPSFSNEILFYYKAGTNYLDSAVALSTSTWKEKVKYTFTYNGDNIAKATEQVFYKDGVETESVTSYTYESSPNIFRNTDPLLYVYINPIADLSYHNFLFYFPKIFSAHTFSTYSLHSGRVGKLNYTLNDKGKITKEWYDQYGYGYEYFYE